MSWTILIFFIGIGLLYYALSLLGIIGFSLPSIHGARAVDKRLSNQYFYKKGGISYCQDGNFLSLGDRMIKDADSPSFVVLSYEYAKDKNQAYFQDRAINNADASSFMIYAGEHVVGKRYLSSSYARDKTHVYYFNKIIPNADINSFKPLWGSFSRDANALYFRGKKFMDTTSVVVKVPGDSQHEYLKLDHTIYYQDKSIDGADVENFVIMGDGFAKDGQHVFYYDQKLEGLDAASFKRLNEHYSRDNENIYYHYQNVFKSLPGCDPASFSVINEAFSKDKQQVYNYSRILKDVNVKTFDRKKAEQMENDTSLLLVNYDEDHAVFIKRDDMVELSSQYYIYNNEIYVGNVRVPNASVDGFAVFENSGMYAKDKKNVFYRFYTVRDADMESFSVINSSFAKDKNYVYFQEKRLQGISPESFEFKEGMYGQAIDDSSAKLVISAEE